MKRYIKLINFVLRVERTEFFPKKIRGKYEERWRDEGKKSKGESMKTKSNHNDGNLCG